MAVKTYSANIDAAGAARAQEVAPASGSSVVAAAGDVDVTDSEAALVVLESDGASPTEAHVDDMRTAFDLYVAAVDALIAAATAPGVVTAGDVVVTVDNTAVANLNRLKAALNAVYTSAEGNDALAKG